MLGKAEDSQPVIHPFVGAYVVNDRMVAGDFPVFPELPEAVPDQRVEPVQSFQYTDQQIQKGISVSAVLQFVKEDKPEFFFRRNDIQILRNDNGGSQPAAGHGILNVTGSIKPDLLPE